MRAASSAAPASRLAARSPCARLLIRGSSRLCLPATPPPGWRPGLGRAWPSRAGRQSALLG
eukprot:7990577-Lingulodinium_polyedra.AAC.1